MQKARDKAPLMRDTNNNKERVHKLVKHVKVSLLVTQTFRHSSSSGGALRALFSVRFLSMAQRAFFCTVKKGYARNVSAFTNNDTFTCLTSVLTFSLRKVHPGLKY